MKTCPVCSTQYADDVKFCPNDGQTLRAAAPAANLVGQVVADRYHVIGKLGEGGMGQVYLAEHVKMGRRSAIKVMNPAMVHDPDAVARFNREAANAARIAHPNVCAIYDFGETPDGLIYLAMEFVEGEPLTGVLEREGALPMARAVAVFLQVADALQAAHDMGIVHRDLKPDNIMLARRKGGAGDVVKVVDFGIAKAVGGEASGQKVTKTGLVVGTPEFMSPEQLSGDTLDGRSDLYSLALVLYRMLTGKLPFEATTVQETMIKRLTDEPTPLAAARPDVAFPAGLQAVLDTALARTPMDRYQSVAKFAADIAAVAGVAGHAGAVPQTRAPGPDAKTQLLDATAGPTTRISAQQRHPSAAPRRRRSAFMPALLAAVVVLAGGGAWVVLSGGSRLDETAGGPDTARDTTAIRAAAPPPPPAAPPAAARLTDRQASDSLDALFDRIDEVSGAMLRDASLDIYNAAGLSAATRAMAAYLAANGFAKLEDRAKTCDWARRAADLAPEARAYTALRQEACGS